MDLIKSFLSKHRARLAGLLLVAAAVLFLFGVYSLLTYSLPMSRHNYVTAMQSKAALNRAEALYAEAGQLYSQGDYKDAVTVLKAAFAACNDSSGQIPASRKQLASNIQLLWGNALFKMQDNDGAAEAYKESLRQNSNNLYSKYNLELLQSQPPGGGGSNGPGGNHHGTNKGI